MKDCKFCIHNERCTVVHCFEFNKYKITVDMELEEHWFNNPDDIASEEIPEVEVKLVNCHAFKHKDPDIYVKELLSNKPVTLSTL